MINDIFLYGLQYICFINLIIFCNIKLFEKVTFLHNTLGKTTPYK